MKHFHLVLILCISCYLLLGCTNLFTSDKSFAIPSIDKITSIELFDQEAHTTLNKEGDAWTINQGQLPVNPLMIKNLLEILTRIDIEYPLPKEDEKDFTPDLLRMEGLRILLYEGKKLIKSYSLSFPDKFDCIGVLENKKQIYRLYLPGANIRLSEYINASPLFWQNNVLFNYRPSQLRAIAVQHNNAKEESFKIERDTLGNLRLFSTNPEQEEPLDSMSAKRYLTYFNGVNFEHYLQLTDKEAETILHTPAVYTLTLTTDEGERSYKAVLKNVGEQKDDYGYPLEYDRDYFYLILEKDQKIVLAKWINFDILFKGLSELKTGKK